MAHLGLVLYTKQTTIPSLFFAHRDTQASQLHHTVFDALSKLAIHGAGVDKALALQPRGPEFDLQNPCKKVRCIGVRCVIPAGKAETGGSLGMTGQPV